MPTAVHFGAGNIGRGFVGLILHGAGYELVFADVNSELIGRLAAADSYEVHEVGEEAATHVVDRFRAIDSAADEEALVREIAAADIVTTAVGPNILRFVAPVIAKGLAARDESAPRLAVMACENAINATRLLQTEVAANLGADEWERLRTRAVFADTAVDRIVPNQDPGQGLDVTVESFFEWVVDRTPFEGTEPEIPGATWVDDLEPFIERKLFTVNTGHATAAYTGFAAGAHKLSDALAMPEVHDAVKAALEDTKALIVAKHGFSDEEQQAYLEKTLKRFANPYLTDTVDRVGRQPLRKLSRHERFIGPAAELAERGRTPEGLLAAIGAALRFDVPEDPQSVELHEKLAALSPEEFVAEVTGLTAEHPLFDRVVAVVRG
ncbi:MULTISPECIES: mannitol-1-phosphate 5-dehydrogenase [unclassified Rathayibacter]|uniref:mannitol-1-phosphate 5-dehydrogenase n=1 Tax=unclassified Rathayibacter TaxID=2609250 RepID=UPI000CE8490D|nr:MULTISPECIES: mannitol-1-phosphate 5-dehydrogenase [unclassified Rathayibacter]PPH02840.1 mannitol-1-phosphate 5-dehydrogenase [Rathayibacter sp. AY1H3]PPH64145.1 mannitol-1-phosphate 5-dehydrogenase [Rathayibacter sp. AY1D7]PPI39594.1 mannitol-1-phosphate 5-dehydrogenase [Rathayibacter sp. RFBD1]PPI57873.1 mannitol-1-phosphate 5-dehydrogenase [Rathayibacter sp. TRS19]QHC71118.1 mannitol-1-phosphate 5-dehydrogenase [Rathayibacter sp. VKM Ac-2801]